MTMKIRTETITIIIMIEQMLLQDTRLAVYLLLAVHYIFNLEYHGVILDSLLFLQEFVLELKEKGKWSAFYTTITSRQAQEYSTCS